MNTGTRIEVRGSDTASRDTYGIVLRGPMTYHADGTGDPGWYAIRYADRLLERRSGLQLGSQLWDQVGSQLWDQVRDQVWDQVREPGKEKS